MRKYTSCVFAVGLACFLTLTAGDLYHFRGNIAEAQFESWDDSGVVTVFWMFAEEYRNQSPPGNGTRRAELIFGAYRYDTVNGFYYFDCSEYRELPQGVFEIDGRLTEATLSTQLDTIDWVSGSPVTLTIDVKVTATGPATRETQHQHVNGPGYRVNYKWTGVGRDGEGTGTVFLNGENLIPNASYYGRLMNVKSMQVIVD